MRNIELPAIAMLSMLFNAFQCNPHRMMANAAEQPMPDPPNQSTWPWPATKLKQ